MKLNVLLVGEESAGIRALRAIAKSEHRLVGVMAREHGAASHGVSVWQAARQLGYDTWPAERVRDPRFAETVRAEAVDLLLNVHSLDIVTRQVLETPRIGCFNLHPGPLPRYAGLNAPSWALYHGETTYGVTLHKMVSQVDAGPIVYQSLFPVQARDTALSLYLKCVREGLVLVERLLETASRSPGQIPLTPQAPPSRSYFHGEAPENGRIRWARPAREILNFVRACDYRPWPSPWGQPRARLNGQEIGVVKAFGTGMPTDRAPGAIGPADDGRARVACGDEWILVQTVEIGGALLAAPDVLKSGDVLQDGGRSRSE